MRHLRDTPRHRATPLRHLCDGPRRRRDARDTKVKAGPKAIYNLFQRGVKAGAANFDKGIIGAPFLYNKIIFKKARGARLQGAAL